MDWHEMILFGFGMELGCKWSTHVDFDDKALPLQDLHMLTQRMSLQLNVE